MFDTLKIEDCLAKVVVPDSRCSDAAFAAAHPDICDSSYLILKPESVLVCALGSVDFHVFEYANGVEAEVTDGLAFSSNEPDIFAVGVNGGSGSGLAVGTAIVTASRNGKTATANITVLGGNCCDDISAKTAILIDDSLSSSLAFNSSYASRLDFAKAAAHQYADDILAKDSAKVWSFASTPDEISTGWLSDATELGVEIDGIIQTQEKTSLLLVLEAAIADLATATDDEKIVLIISDGEQTTDTVFQPAIDAAASFKADGGIIMVIGLRASGGGYDLLSRIATGGFFLNATSANPADVLARMNHLKGALCVGRCKTASGNVNQPELNFSSFQNWEVVTGMVNLIGNGFMDLLPGNGLYVDLAGGATAIAASAAKIQTIDAFPVISGLSYQISFKAAGNNRMNVASQQAVKVAVRNSTASDTDPDIFNHVVSLNWNDGFQSFSFIFTAPYDADVKLSFEQLVSGAFVASAAEWHGNLLDDVEFSEVSTLTMLLLDNFDGENPVYVHDGCCANTESSTSSSTETLIPVMTSDTLPSGVASASTQGVNQEAWRAFDDSDSSVWDNQYAGIPAWIQYQFSSKKVITSYQFRSDFGTGMPSEWEFQGSNNGTDWTTLDSQSILPPAPYTSPILQLTNTTAYLYYRMFISAIESGWVDVSITWLKMFGYADNGTDDCGSNDLIPAMTSATNPSGIASCSSAVPPHGPYQWEAWCAMTGIQSNEPQWQSAIYPSVGTPAWLKYQFPTPQVVTEYRMGMANNTAHPTDSGTGPKSWTFQGSMNDLDWTTLDSHTDYVAASDDVNGPPTRFPISNTQAFLYYRLVVTKTNNGGNVGVSQFQMSHPTTGSGFGCYADCPDSTADTQIQDPFPLPDIETGSSSVSQSYSSTQRVCVSCPTGTVNMIGDTAVAGDTSVCATATKSSSVSQADADSKATAAAMLAANALLNCKPVYSATKMVHLTCPANALGNAVDKTASATSYTSQADADEKAIAAATALAQAELDCTGSNNENRVVINDNAPASQYPSVQYLSGLVGAIVKFAVNVYGLTHGSIGDVQMLLLGPDGTAVMLMQNCGGANAVSGIDLSFYDSAATALPQNTALVSGIFKPTQFGVTPSFPVPAPQPPYNTALSAFTGKSPNGSWSLWVIDDAGLDAGSFDSWEMTGMLLI
jgi:subtilisin-like proprotein convertase family protein